MTDTLTVKPMQNPILAICICLLMSFTGCGTQQNGSTVEQSDGNKSEKIVAPEQGLFIDAVVEASCGQCQLGLKGKKGCDLAIRIKGNAYYVDGSSIDDHGNAHAEDGLCNCIRKARVSGKITEGRFKASSFVLLSKD